MTDMPENDAVDGPITFVRWLHAQAKSDVDRVMPYSAVYRWGPNIQSILGTDGRYASEWVALKLSQQGADAEDLAALASAEAAWRVDSLVESAEIAGVPLDMGSNEEVVSKTVTDLVASSEAKVLCGYRNHRGEGCISEAVAGAGRCGRHGGAITDPEVRRSFLLIAFAKVSDGSRIAVDALLDVAENGRSEMARVQAAKELLDRAGVQQDQHVHIHKPAEGRSEDELLDALRSRLNETKDRLRLMAIDAVSYEENISPFLLTPELVVRAASDDGIVDAELIEAVSVESND